MGNYCKRATYITGTGATNGAALYSTTGSSSFGGAITLGGNATIRANGSLALTYTSTTPAISIGSNTLTFGSGNIAVSGVIGGTSSASGSLVMSSSGNVTLSGANNYTGSTTISNGKLIAASPSALGTTSAGQTISVASGSELELNFGTGTIALTNQDALQLNGTGISSAGALYDADATGTDTATIANPITLEGSATIGSAGGILSLTSGATIASNANNNYGVTFAGSGAIDAAGAIKNCTGTSCTGITSVTMTGGTLNLSGISTYTGATTVSAGILTAGNNAAFGGSQVNVTNNSTLQINNGFTVGNNLSLDGTLNGSGSGTSTYSGSITLAGNSTIGTASAANALTISGAINDTSSGADILTTAGSGTLTIGNTIGKTIPIKSFTTSNSGTTTITSSGSSNSITTVNNQTYNDAITLDSDVKFTSNSGGLLFNAAATINGAKNITIVTATGTTIDSVIGGVLPTTNPLSLNIDGGTDTLSANITTAGNEPL